MEPILFVRTAAVLPAITVVGGLAMAAVRFSGDGQPPAWLAMLHGLLAAAAITLLIFAAASVGLPNLALAALVLFVIAAAAGAFLNLNYQGSRCSCRRALSSRTPWWRWSGSCCFSSWRCARQCSDCAAWYEARSCARG
ncbi:MAG: hypothetical protein ABI330_19070 [Caldimonas sp.]